MAVSGRNHTYKSAENTSLPMLSTDSCRSRPKRSIMASGELDLLPLNMSTSGRRFASVFYKRSSAEYGSEQPEKLLGPAFGVSSKFSGDLARAGMYKRQGLETSIARERVVEGSKDWLMKIL